MSKVEALRSAEQVYQEFSDLGRVFTTTEVKAEAYRRLSPWFDRAQVGRLVDAVDRKRTR